MSAKIIPFHLNRSSQWISILATFLLLASAPQLLRAETVTSCSTYVDLSLDTTFRWQSPEGIESPADSRQCYAVTTDSPGLLLLDISPLGSPIIEPWLFFEPSPSSDYRLLWETPLGAILEVETPGALRLTVVQGGGADVQGGDETTPLAYKLRNTFFAEAELPLEVASFDQDLPDLCQDPAPPLMSLPFSVSTTVEIDEVDEDDCDVMTVPFNVPGVVLIESPERSLQASLYSDASCVGSSLLAEGLIGEDGGSLILPTHPGELRLTVEPTEASTGGYGPTVHFLAPCHRGETDDHGDMPLCATPLQVGGSIDGTIANLPGDDQDFLTFVLEQQQQVRVEVTKSPDVVTALFDDELRQLASADSDPTSQQLIRVLPPGRYYLRLEGAERFTMEEEYSVRLEVLNG